MSFCFVLNKQGLICFKNIHGCLLSLTCYQGKQTYGLDLCHVLEAGLSAEMLFQTEFSADARVHCEYYFTSKVETNTEVDLEMLNLPLMFSL